MQQAGLSAYANIYSPLDLKPWDEKTATACLAALAETYRLELSEDVRRAMCRRLRCQIPHHVQRFFDMLGVPGQMDMPHYESRFRTALGDEGTESPSRC